MNLQRPHATEDIKGFDGHEIVGKPITCIRETRETPSSHATITLRDMSSLTHSNTARNGTVKIPQSLIDTSHAHDQNLPPLIQGTDNTQGIDLLSGGGL